MSIDHWMLFGTFAQQNYFEYPVRGTYCGTIINANMAAHAPAGLAAFLLEKTANTRYIIDPLTHAFQHAPEAICNDAGELKSSVRSLAEEYGEPVSSIVGTKPLLPSAFEDESVVHHFSERCVSFQCNQLTSYMKQSDAAKYLDDSDIAPPYAVIAPYFFMTETTLSDWLRVNIACAEHVASRRGDLESKVFAAVVVDQGILLDESYLLKIAEAYASISGIEGVLLWVDSLDEQDASGAALKALLRLARGLRQSEREVVNLHGGYFSVLAAGAPGDRALTGVTHGPEFGEFRGVVPVGGGIPIARYYIPDLHARIRYADALRFLRAQGWLDNAELFQENVCDCEVCVGVLREGAENFVQFGESNVKRVKRRSGLVRIAYPTKAAKELCLKHYLQRKRREYVAASEATANVLLEDLIHGASKYEDVTGLEGVEHLRLWHRVLKESGSSDS